MSRPMPTMPAADAAAEARYLLDRAELLVGEAERHADRGDRAGLYAALAAVNEPMTQIDILVRPVRPEYQDLDSPERREVMEQAAMANAQLRAALPLVETDENYEEAPERERANRESVRLAGHAYGLIATARALTLASERADDQQSVTEQRWANAVLIERATRDMIRWLGPELVGQQELAQQRAEDLGRDHIALWKRIQQQTSQAKSGALEGHGGVIRRLALESGAHEVSGGAALRITALRSLLIETERDDADWTLGISIHEEGDCPTLPDLVMFRHDERVHVKTIDEAYPKGYPGQTAARQMCEVIEAARRRPPGSPCGWAHDEAVAMLSRAHRETHQATPGGTAEFVRRTNALLNEDLHKVQAVFRGVTRNDPRVTQQLTPDEKSTSGFANAEQAEAIMRTAAGSGLDETRLRELARLMGMAAPEGRNSWAVGRDTLKEIAEAARATGLGDQVARELLAGLILPIADSEDGE